MPERIATKPYVSKRQARWANATGQSFAKRWNKLTRFAGLPEKKGAGTTAGTPLAGPGGLLGTPGMGTRRRTWAQRLKAAGYSARAGETIRGNLARGGDGKFTAAGNASAAKPKRGDQLSKPPRLSTRRPIKAAAPKKAGGGKGRAPAKPKQTPEQRQAARAQERNATQTANRDAVKQAMADQDLGLAPRGFDNLMGLAAGTTPDQLGADGLVSMGMAERGSDGTLRLTASGRAAVNAANRGDAKAAIDAVSRGSDQAKQRSEAAAKRTAAAAERATADAKKKLEAKQPKAGGGGGGKKPSDADKRQERSRQADATAQEVGLAPRDVDALRQAAAGLGGVTNPAMTALGLIGADGLTTDQGRRALSALERGDVRGYHAALQDAKARVGRETAAADRKRQAEGKRAAAANERSAKQRQALDRLKRQAQRGGKLTQTQRDQLTDAGLASETGGMWRLKHARQKPADNHADQHRKDNQQAKEYQRGDEFSHTESISSSFAVFKDASGAHRWIARTTTAYRDRDQEIISSAALDQDSQRMTTTKQFGPLRYWHVGQPDPFDAAQPWGPGLDIGDCDYSCLIGRTRIESGTFRDVAIARKVAQQADSYELSPGFFHPLDQPSPDGVFSAIRTFERSLVPTRYGRASNLFTGLAVKEQRMDINEMEKRFKAAVIDLGLDKDQALALGASLIATEKAAEAQGIAYKAETPADAPPTPPDEITIGGVVYTVKAAPPPPEAMPAVETQADGVIEEVADEVIDDDMGMDDGALVDAIASRTADLLMERLTPLFGDMKMSEFKTLLSGYATKDAGRAQELAALKASLADVTAKIAQIEGDQPAVVLPDEVAAALKSEGPATADPNGLDIPDDPSRPFAQIAARTMPQLYRNGPAGEFAGWTPPPAAS